MFFSFAITMDHELCTFTMKRWAISEC